VIKVLDSSIVQQDLFPKLAALFTATKSLSVKCECLNTFKLLLEVLPKHILVDQLVPLLAGIRTKEPDVTMATLDVYQGLIQKLDVQALATSVLPQLWSLSLSPLLRLDQFRSFQRTIKSASERIVMEQERKLSQAARSSPVSQSRQHPQANAISNGAVDFESLVSSDHPQQPRNPPPPQGRSDWDAWATVSTSITPDPPMQWPTIQPVPTSSPNKASPSLAGIKKDGLDKYAPLL